MKRTLPLAEVYRLPETGPIVLLTTARKSRSWLPEKWLHCPRARN